MEKEKMRQKIVGQYRIKIHHKADGSETFEIQRRKMKIFKWSIWSNAREYKAWEKRFHNVEFPTLYEADRVMNRMIDKRLAETTVKSNIISNEITHK